MEELCASLFGRVEQTLQRCLDASGLKQEDVGEIELIGGSTRIPAVKLAIERVFGKAPSTTLNQDECVARGAAIMAAMLSPNFKVREFSLTDLQPYPVVLDWGGDDADKGHLEVFPLFHAVPFSKLLTFYRKGPFVLSARYAPDVQRIHRTDDVGQFQVLGVKPGAQGEAQKVKVKVRLNMHGVLQVVSATLMEKQANQTNGEASASVETEGMDTEPAGEDAAAAAPSADATKMETNEAEVAAEGSAPAATAAAPKQVVKAVDLEVESRTASMDTKKLQRLNEREAELQSQDRQERDRIDSKNALEEFVLGIRGRVNDSDDLEPFIDAATRDKLVKMADDTENWLYDEGEDCEKSVYVQRLEQIQGLAVPAQSRKRDHEGAPRAAESLAALLNRAQKALASYQAGELIFDHWTAEEAQKLGQGIADKKSWLDSNFSKIRATPKTQDLPVKAAAFAQEQQVRQVIFNNPYCSSLTIKLSIFYSF